MATAEYVFIGGQGAALAAGDERRLESSVDSDVIGTKKPFSGQARSHSTMLTSVPRSVCRRVCDRIYARMSEAGAAATGEPSVATHRGVSPQAEGGACDRATLARKTSAAAPRTSSL